MNNTIDQFTGVFKGSNFNIANILSTVGNAISSAFQWVITKVSNMGLHVSLFVSKLIAIFVIGLIIYFATKIVSKVWKVLLIILFFIILTCVGYTFFVPVI
jgi:hypothetical protein